MISIEDIYKACNLDDRLEFQNKAILRNVKKIENGDFPVYDIFRQTGRSTFICAATISLMSIGQTVVIYTHNLSIAKAIRNKIIDMSKNVSMYTGCNWLPLDNFIVTTEDNKRMDLIGRRWDLELIDPAILDLDMKATGFYK
jgi:hypothetical protein